ncbi:MAG: flagellar FlbD family protein [Clostridiaceae bacterium]
MIKLTMLSRQNFVLNAEIIEKIEEVPETVITLTNGKKYLVFESADEVIEKVIAFKQKIFNYKG